jgi:hypothetical protein
MRAPVMRLLPCVHATNGTLLLLSPPFLTRAISTTEHEATTVAFVRLLGARHLLQAAVLSRRRSRSWAIASAIVDATHGATMIALAVRKPDRRRLAAASALAAIALAAAGSALRPRRHMPSIP